MQESSRRETTPSSEDEHEQRPNARKHVEAVLERELAHEVERVSSRESRDVKEVALELREHAIADISTSERQEKSRRSLARTYQFVDYIFYVAYSLIGLLIVLELLGARDGNGFMKFMRTVTAPLVAPFRGVLPDPAVGSFQLMLSYVIALVVYLLLHKGVRRLFEILAHRQPAEL